MRRLFGAFTEILDESWYSPQEIIDAGDSVVVVLRWGGQGKGSGVRFEERDETWIFEVRDGKVARVTEYARKDDALRAAGLAAADS